MIAEHVDVPQELIRPAEYQIFLNGIVVIWRQWAVIGQRDDVCVVAVSYAVDHPKYLDHSLGKMVKGC